MVIISRISSKNKGYIAILAGFDYGDEVLIGWSNHE
jgi:hypothetical protein